MPLEISIRLGTDELALLQVERLQSLRHNKETYTYQAHITAEAWNDGITAASGKFTHDYADGMLVLLQKACSALLRCYPELRAGRLGIPRNRAKCRKCGDIIWSTHRHDFIRCRCGAIALDGGYDYCRRAFTDANDFIEVPESWQKLASYRKRMASRKSKTNHIHKPAVKCED